MSNQIDIVLLTFNRLEFTKRTIEELYKRIHTPFRLIIVDNVSVDGTREYILKLKEEKWNVRLKLLQESSTICEGYNQGFKLVESELFITMQDDVIVPDLDPDVIQRLIALMNKYPNHGGIACRIQHIPNVKWLDEELSPARKALSAYFRIQRKSDIEEMGGFGERHWDDLAFTDGMRKIGKEVSWATNLWCNHIGHCENRGYGEHKRSWGYPFKNDKIKSLVYPKIDFETNKPL